MNRKAIRRRERKHYALAAWCLFLLLFAQMWVLAVLLEP